MEAEKIEKMTPAECGSHFKELQRKKYKDALIQIKELLQENSFGRVEEEEKSRRNSSLSIDGVSCLGS